MSNEEQIRQAIRELIEKELEELTGTGAIDGFGTPHAFQGDSEANKKKRKDSAESVDGFEVIGEGITAELGRKIIAYVGGKALEKQGITDATPAQKLDAGVKFVDKKLVDRRARHAKEADEKAKALLQQIDRHSAERLARRAGRDSELEAAKDDMALAWNQMKVGAKMAGQSLKKKVTPRKPSDIERQANAAAHKRRGDQFRSSIANKKAKARQGAHANALRGKTVKNPVTGRQIQAMTALGYGPNHPAYKAVKASLGEAWPPKGMNVKKYGKSGTGDPSFDKRYDVDSCGNCGKTLKSSEEYNNGWCARCQYKFKYPNESVQSMNINEAEKRKGFEQRAAKFLSTVQKKLDAHTKKSYPDFRGNDTKLEFNKGSKYWRIVASSGSSRSAWGFLNTQTGDILKAAGWKAPAKGPRGNIFDSDFGISKVGPYGPQYKKGPSYGWRENVQEAGDPYYAWRNDETKSPRMKIGEAISEMNQQLREMEKSVKRCRRLRSEANLATSDYWNRTNSALMKMESRMHNIAKMVRDMRG